MNAFIMLDDDQDCNVAIQYIDNYVVFYRWYEVETGVTPFNVLPI